MIKDERSKPKLKPFGYIVMNDRFMSGWGEAAHGRSLYAIAVTSEAEGYTVLRNAQDRPEMKYVRFNRTLPRLRTGDRLSIADRGTARRWFRAGAFR